MELLDGINVTGTFTMLGGIIKDNYANTNGGGIFLAISGNVTINKGTISQNTAGINGGGIYIRQGANVNITGKDGECYITKNKAGTDGGGIYVEDTTCSNLNTSDNTVFGCNIASVAYKPPSNASTVYPDVGFASTTIEDHPLNNFDINYEGTEVITTVFNINYNANGGVGSHIGPDINLCDTDTVLSLEETGITNDGYTFTGWNTKPDGSGTNYKPGDVIKLTDNLTLYAQWKEVKEEYTVDFESNGGTSIDSQTVPSDKTATKPNDPTKQCYIFDGWYTDDGTFENEWDFNTPINENITLYAKWIEDPNCKPCDCKCPFIWIFIILIILVIFCKKIKCFIKCIICKIKKWIRC